MKKSDKLWSWIAVSTMLCLGFFLYLPSLDAPFYWDDVANIQKNWLLLEPWRLDRLWNHWPSRIVTHLSFSLEIVSQGQAYPDTLRAVNILIHATTAFLLFKMIRRTLPKFHPILAILCAGLFLAHPLQAESVTYIVQRATSLAALLSMASWYYFARYLKNTRSKSLFFASFVLAALAMLSKENAVILPLWLLVYSYYFVEKPLRPPKRVQLTLLSLIAIVPVSALATQTYQLHNLARTQEAATLFSPLDYFAAQWLVVWRYLGLAAGWIPQNFDPYVERLSFPYSAWHYLAFGGLAVLILIAVKLRRRLPVVSFGIIFFFFALLPESSIFPIKDLMFEHRIYLPLAGLTLSFAGLLQTALDKYSGSRIKPTVWLAAVLGFILAVLSNQTFQRNQLWADPVKLWEDAVKKSPQKARPASILGGIWLEKGNYAKASEHLDQALKLNPYYLGARINRGLLMMETGKLNEALEDFSIALHIDPKFEEAYFWRAKIYQKKNENALALADLEKAALVKPETPAVYLELGNYYKDNANFEKAILYYTKALDHSPRYIDALNNRANAYYMTGKIESALSDYDKALQINPTDPDLQSNRAFIKNRLGR